MVLVASVAVAVGFGSLVIGSLTLVGLFSVFAFVVG